MNPLVESGTEGRESQPVHYFTKPGFTFCSAEYGCDVVSLSEAAPQRQGMPEQLVTQPHLLLLRECICNQTFKGSALAIVVLVLLSRQR